MGGGAACCAPGGLAEGFKVFSDMGHPAAIGGLAVILSQAARPPNSTSAERPVAGLSALA